jgi:nucleoside-diphosphate-sugar epimerase
VTVDHKRTVVTGGAGFIGSHLVEHLLGQGHDVVVLDDFSTGRRENLAPFTDRIAVVEASITDPGACDRALEGADYVFHQAALGSVPRSVADPVRTHEVNLTGTLNVLNAARHAGVKRVVYAASSSAYGNTPVLPKHEGMTPLPRSPYAVAKLGGEEYGRAFHASYGLETVSLRYFNVFGARQDPESQYAAVIPLFFAAALENRPPTIFGDGEQTRDFTHISNVVRANMLALEAPDEALGEVFNVGCGERISINDLWREIREVTGATTSAEHLAARPGDVRDSLASLDRSRSVLGYEPAVDLREGIRRTAEWFSRDSAGSSVST